MVMTTIILIISHAKRSKLEAILELMATLSFSGGGRIVVGVAGGGVWGWLMCGDDVTSRDR